MDFATNTCTLATMQVHVDIVHESVYKVQSSQSIQQLRTYVA